MRGRLALRIGLALVAAGLLLAGFVAFQLFGTALYEHHRQADLAAQLPAKEGINARALADPGTPASGLPPIARSPAPATAAPPVGAPIGYVVIPRIGLDAVVVEGVGAAQLRGGPGHYAGTAVPGQAGNAAIAGHRTTYAAPFSQLNLLRVGDPVYVLTTQGLFRYDVVSSQAVAPTDVSVLDPSATTELTLTTCTPRYSAAQRLVVMAVLDHGAGPAPVRSVPPPAPRSATGPSRGLAGEATGSTLWVVLGGVLVAALAVGVWFACLRARTGRRWVVLVVGIPLVLAALLLFYAQLSLDLPATL